MRCVLVLVTSKLAAATCRRSLLLVLMTTSVVAHADEVDDILVKGLHAQNRIVRFSAEFTVETDQPKSRPNPMTTRMRYHISRERNSAVPGGHPGSLWRTDLVLLEPSGTAMRIEGEHIWYQVGTGPWKAIDLPSMQSERLHELIKGFTGQADGHARDHFTIKVLRHNNPIFGPKSVTLEYLPRGQQKLFERMESDVDGDGLSLATRLYDAGGRQTTRVRVIKHRLVSGVPMMEAMEAVSQTPAGEVVSRTTCSAIQVETEP